MDPKRLRAMDAERQYVGGLKTPFLGFELRPWGAGASASWPLGELLIGRHEVRVQLRFALTRVVMGRLMPPFQASIDALLAKPVGSSPITRGVLLSSPASRPRTVIFWCVGKAEQSEILDLLSERGATIEDA